jgi:hypothetical protein
MTLTSDKRDRMSHNYLCAADRAWHQDGLTDRSTNRPQVETRIRPFTFSTLGLFSYPKMGAARSFEMPINIYQTARVTSHTTIIFTKSGFFYFLMALYTFSKLYRQNTISGNFPALVIHAD